MKPNNEQQDSGTHCFDAHLVMWGHSDSGEFGSSLLSRKISSDLSFRVYDHD